MVEDAELKKRWLVTPITGATFIRYIRAFENRLAEVWDSLQSLREEVDGLQPPVLGDDHVQQGLEASARKLGQRVVVTRSLVVTAAALRRQLGNEIAEVLLSQSGEAVPDAMDFQGCRGVVVNRDLVARRVLVRLLFRPPLLMFFDEQELEVVDDGALPIFDPFAVEPEVPQQE